MKKHLTLENAAELFELCKRKSARMVEELLAARFPRPDVRDLVRRLPAQAGLTLNEYGWRFRSRAKVSVALVFFSFFAPLFWLGRKLGNGLSQSSIRALVAHRWRSVGRTQS
jgi:hypothetical protein